VPSRSVVNGASAKLRGCQGGGRLLLAKCNRLHAPVRPGALLPSPHVAVAAATSLRWWKGDGPGCRGRVSPCSARHSASGAVLPHAKVMCPGSAEDCPIGCLRHPSVRRSWSGL